jgi:hypothetical protein
MHVNNYSLKRPPEKLLDQCHRVIISDPAFLMWRMKKYCQEQELSLVWSELVDTSDIDYNYDHMAAFYFIDSHDATMFTLKFK